MSTTADAAPRGQRVGWLELFFDLVFVVVIEQLTHRLHGDPGLIDFAIVFGLFAFVWACWLNVTLLTNVSGPSPAWFRPFVFASMAGVGLIPIAVPRAGGDGGWLFAIGYAVARVAVWPLWIGRGAPGFVRPLIFGPGIAALWVASIAIPMPWRWIAWSVLLVVEIAWLVSGLPSVRRDVDHMVERVGLFIMIVLGESVVQLVLAVRLDRLGVEWPIALMSFAVVCAFWWIYFDIGAQETERIEGDASGGIFRDVLVIDHFLFVLSLILLAAGLGGAIEGSTDDHLAFGTVASIGGGSALFYLAQSFATAKYGVRSRRLLASSIPAIALSVVVLLFGAAWAPWLVVAVILAIAVAHATVGGWLARRR
ncbi:MAG: hypothetical protein JWN36_2151 [Microbacteriaceae bacterium]|nr:hypothetical protein [Microbacteriaceae bacterium]